MSRALRVQDLGQVKQLLARYSLNQSPCVTRRTLATTSAARGKSTDWLRKKLWKGQAPGPEDPYTQRSEPEECTELPQEALPKEKQREKKVPAAARIIQGSRIVLPPKRTEAVSEKEVKFSDPTYIPATKAEGLEAVVKVKEWWDQPGHWGKESEFKGFGHPFRITDKDVVEVYLRRAVVEVLALQKSGVFRQWAYQKWREGDKHDLARALAVDISVEDGKATLIGKTSAITKSLTAGDDKGDAPSRITPEEVKDMKKAWDSSWKDFVVDEDIKFALRKRLYQLSGTLVPDARLGAARTVKHILTLAAKEPKPPKLAQQLSRHDELRQIPNVALHNRRIGSIDKEIAVGRWKLIEEELRKRNIPATGTSKLNRNKEMDWLLGKI